MVVKGKEVRMEEYNYVEHMTIKEFPEEERPIENLLK